MIATIARAVGTASAVVLLMSACGSSSSSTPGAATAGVTMPATGAVGVASSSVGTFLVDAQGRSMYLFGIDSPGHSNCTDSCTTYWMPEPASPTPSAAAGVAVTFGTLDRPDGTAQLTVGGLPVYTYSGDTSPGMTAGQGVTASGGQWWLVSPTGTALHGSGTPASPTPSVSHSTPSRGY